LIYLSRLQDTIVEQRRCPVAVTIKGFNDRSHLVDDVVGEIALFGGDVLEDVTNGHGQCTLRVLFEFIERLLVEYEVLLFEFIQSLYEVFGVGKRLELASPIPASQSLCNDGLDVVTIARKRRDFAWKFGKSAK
jgi:hypothetical protein